MPRQPWPTLPLNQWPRHDRAAWETAIRPGDPLSPSGPAAGMAPTTKRSMACLYGQVLRWLQEHGQLDPEQGPADRLTHERFIGYLTARRASVSENTVFANLRMLAMMMNCLAPGREWGWLYRHPLAPRSREAAQARRPVKLVRPGLLFARLAQALAGAQSALPGPENAILLRDLLLVAIGATTALRLRNLNALTLKDSIRRHGHGYEIRFPANGVKNARAMTLALMPELIAPLDAYLGAFRPCLLGGGDAGGALWVSRDGHRLSRRAIQTAFQTAFQTVTSKLLGRAVNPHAMRHSAASEILALSPLDAATAAAVLAHRGTDTLARHYDFSGDAAAQKVLQGLLGRHRVGHAAGRRPGGSTTSPSTLQPKRK